jgi:hypothetical protein
VKGGASEVRVPVYSHERYDIVPGAELVVRQPRLLLMEGLALTESEIAPLVDVVVYLDDDTVRCRNPQTACRGQEGLGVGLAVSHVVGRQNDVDVPVEALQGCS